jgi:hypothetical protein
LLDNSCMTRPYRPQQHTPNRRFPWPTRTIAGSQLI